MSEPVLLKERDGDVMTLRLNRPELGNAINVALATALHEAAIECDIDTGIRCVVLTGAGKMFCAGGDIGLFAESGDHIPDVLHELATWLHGAVSRLSRMNKPLITSINGAAAGAGLSLALLGDVALAAQSAKFAMAYGGIGLSPDGGSTWLLPRLVGLRRAQELAVANRRLTAEEAAAMGLVTRIVADADLAADTAATARTLADAATRAIGRTRQLLLSSFGNSLEEQLELEARSISEAGGAPEGREGVAAFLARRKPDFRNA
jgi:2-(1,2-epoxy-1,2-dihydrophenyl)acetyl-CoA isomerase